MTGLAKALRGVSGILVTPFDGSDEIAPDLQKPIVDRAIAAGVQGLTANGNTGEFYGLTLEEACAMVRASGAHIAGRVPMVALMGEDCGSARPPAAWPLAKDQSARLRAFMTTHGLI